MPAVCIHHSCMSMRSSETHEDDLRSVRDARKNTLLLRTTDTFVCPLPVSKGSTILYICQNLEKFPTDAVLSFTNPSG